MFPGLDLYSIIMVSVILNNINGITIDHDISVACFMLLFRLYYVFYINFHFTYGQNMFHWNKTLKESFGLYFNKCDFVIYIYVYV